MLKDILGQIRYFASFNVQQLDLLQSISSTKKLANGEILFYEGENPTHIYYLLQGQLRVLKSQGELKQVHVHTMYPGVFVAEVTIFQKMSYPATTEANGPCEVLAIDKDLFCEKFLNDVDLLKQMLRSLSSKIGYLMQSIELETALTTEIKIAKFILAHQDDIEKIKHKDIAIELNSTPETVSRIIKKFVENGFLARSNPIKVKNINGLRILCS
jgi:CRP/FNR family transcriptional regulator